MKKWLCLAMAVLMTVSLLGCSASDGGKNPETPEGEFQVGFGRVDITPTEPVHLASYGDQDTRISEGVMHPLYSHAIVMRDAVGTTMVMVTTDLTWGSNKICNEVRPLVEERFGITEEYVTIGGTHNHNGPSYGYEAPADVAYKEQFKEGVLESIQLAMDDLAPAQIQIGRTETENLTFVRRYYLADGNMTGDNFNYTHNSTITAHESEADEEIQMVRFVRQDADDILMINWQTHAAKHGHTNYMSADFAGPLRDKVDDALGVHSVFYQGACGNLNPVSRIEGECATGGTGYQKAVDHGERVADYVIAAWNSDDCFRTINSGNIEVTHTKFIAKQTWAEANAITVGDLSLVTLPAEFFDSLGKTIKDETPYEMTVLMGFTCGIGQYLATEEGFLHGGYEVTNSQFRKGEGEQFVQFYLDILNEMYDGQHA